MKFIEYWIAGLAMCAGIAVPALAMPPVDNPVILWNRAAIDAARDNNSGTLVVVRALAVMHTAMFDAWTQYDCIAQPTRDTPLRRPTSERTMENKRKAISYAAYRTLVDLFPSGSAKFDQLMIALGYDPENESRDPATPA